LRPIVSTDDLQGEVADAARAAAAHSPPDAIFIAPPSFGILRIVGQRALVVDFEAIPFQDEPMREWRERIRTVYGQVQAGGHAAREALDGAYRATSDARLLAAAERYGASHAVLYRETPTAFPELYVNRVYRVVRLVPSVEVTGEGRAPSR
jgi:hypothetical protein